MDMRETIEAIRDMKNGETVRPQPGLSIHRGRTDRAGWYFAFRDYGRFILYRQGKWSSSWDDTEETWFEHPEELADSLHVADIEGKPQ